MAKPKRVYQVWKGNNIFICNGRLVFGPDAKGLVVTLLLITVPVAFFLTFVARNLLHGVSESEGGYTILLVAIFLTVFVLLMLFLTSAQDPGFIPRNLHPPEGEISRTKEVVINNRTVVVKYCDTCKFYRPPRCSHCSECDNCVEQFDHHCLWVGQCIGLIFICNGRLVFGPDAKRLVLTLLLIIVPVAFFFTFVARNLLHGVSEYKAGYTILLVPIFLTIFVLVMLFLTSAQDPGFIPRNLQPPQGEVTGEVKYCVTCKLYRPPRCSHCRLCDNCVERFDHHCPWAGQCIGLRNRRWFFLLVFTSTLLCSFVFAMSALYIKFLTDDHGTVWKAMKASPVSVILMAYCFIFFWFPGALTFFHLYLIGKNQTTHESCRYGSESRLRDYDRGLINNFHEVFYAKLRPGIDFHAYIEENVQENEPTPGTSLTPVGEADYLGRDRSIKIEGDQERSGDHPVVPTEHHDV